MEKKKKNRKDYIPKIEDMISRRGYQNNNKHSDPKKKNP